MRPQAPSRRQKDPLLGFCACVGFVQNHALGTELCATVSSLSATSRVDLLALCFPEFPYVNPLIPVSCAKLEPEPGP